MTICGLSVNTGPYRSSCLRQARAGSGACASHETWALRHPSEPRAQKIIRAMVRAELPRAEVDVLVARVLAELRTAKTRPRPVRRKARRPVAIPPARARIDSGFTSLPATPPRAKRKPRPTAARTAPVEIPVMRTRWAAVR